MALKVEGVADRGMHGRCSGRDPLTNTGRPFSRCSAAHPMGPAWCAQSHPMNGPKCRSIHRSTISLPAMRTPLTSRRNAVGNSSTPRPAAINATLSEEKRDVTTFTDNDFHNIGIGIIRHNVVALAQQAEQMINSGHLEEVDRAAAGTDFSALGRFLISKKEADIAAFKTPDIRNILVTGPYFHNGS